MRLAYWKKQLKSYDIGEKEYNRYKEELLRKDPKFTDSDVIWGFFQKLKLKDNSLDYLKSIFFHEALFLYEEGRKPLVQLREFHKIELINFKDSGVKQVKILTCEDSCDSCKKNEGKILTIDQALKEMPLPCKGCSFEFKKSKKGWCRCCYQAVYETETQADNKKLIKKAWYKSWWGILIIIGLFPIMIPILVWTKTNWPKFIKIIITVICLLILLSGSLVE
jgi:hypothetical protein